MNHGVPYSQLYNYIVKIHSYLFWKKIVHMTYVKIGYTGIFVKVFLYVIIWFMITIYNKKNRMKKNRIVKVNKVKTWTLKVDQEFCDLKSNYK